MSQAPITGTWTDGEGYEDYLGRWSRKIAPTFLTWIGIPPQRAWLDLGCGTGALTQALLDNCDPSAVTAVDPMEAQLLAARARISDARVTFHLAGGEQLPLLNASCDAAVSGLVLPFLPKPETALSEQRRVVRSGGTVGAYMFDYTGGSEIVRYFWEAAVALDPVARQLDTDVRFPVARLGPLVDLWRSVGLDKAETRCIDVPAIFAGFDAYWARFLGTYGQAPRYCMSLNEERRGALRERLRDLLPKRADGSINLIVRALAVKGLVP
jgi:SAM-dependent methyltransferase